MRHPAAESLGVGDVRLVRTFRVGRDGGLYPVNCGRPWSDGWNHAACAKGRDHAAPADDCTCGFYAYGDVASATAQPPAGQVLAVVAAHGAMVAGTKGARVEHARVEAVWLGRRVGAALEQRMRDRYPTVLTYRNLRAMLTDLPPTHLPGFVRPRWTARHRRPVRLALGLLFLTGPAMTFLPGAVPANPAGLAVRGLAFGAAAAALLSGLVTRSPTTSGVNRVAPAGPRAPPATRR